MTDERAIEILDPEHREHYESIEPVEEACRIGIKAIKRVKELEAENAELRARLDKAVELPCKENQEIYYINEKGKIVLRYARTVKIMFELGIEVEATAWERGENEMLVLKTNLIHSNEFGDRAFLTKEAAEARLKEIKGNNND